MSTVHEQVADENLIRMLENPDAAAKLAWWMRRFRSRQVEPGEFAVYGQTFARLGAWSPAQLAAALYCHGAVLSGGYLWITHFLDSEGPDRDAERAANRAVLEAQLPASLRVSVWDADLTDDDGEIEWDEPILMRRSTLAAPNAEMTADDVLVRPGCVPLEIGYTMPSKTLQHLTMEGGVARWPYGADYVQIIVKADRVLSPG